MATYARVKDNVVIDVIRVESEDVLEHIPHEEGAMWVQTSYNTTRGVHAQGKAPLRMNYAAIGHVYDPVLDAFYEPQPYPSWVLDEKTATWVPPILPADDIPLHAQIWNEEALTWDRRF